MPQRNGAPLKRARAKKAAPIKRTVNGIPVPPNPPPEPGIDLSTVPVCPSCGLEIANLSCHQTWHDAQAGQFKILQDSISSLAALLVKALQGTAAEMPVITVDPTKHEDWNAVYNSSWDPTLMKRRFKSWPEREKVKNEKIAKEQRATLKKMANVPDGKENW